MSETARLLPLLWIVGCLTSSGDGKGNRNGNGNAGCSSASDCESLEFCYRSECEPVLGREYRVEIESATAATNADWDVGGGAPDPVVSVSTDGREWCSTSEQSDTFTPSWYEGCDEVFEEGGQFFLEMIDADVSDDDRMLTYSTQGSDDLVDLVVSQDIRLENDNVTLYLNITPNF